MSDRTHGLVILLRGLAIVNFSALAAVVAPRTWLAECHEWLGLGAFPSSSITSYLARSTSLWFTAFGILLWVVSGDVSRHRWLIGFIGWAMTLQGILMIAIDWHEGLPVWWILAEGPSCILLGVLILLLDRACRSGLQRAANPGPAPE